MEKITQQNCLQLAEKVLGKPTETSMQESGHMRAWIIVLNWCQQNGMLPGIERPTTPGLERVIEFLESQKTKITDLRSQVSDLKDTIADLENEAEVNRVSRNI